ncbi:MAG: hypothetical protein DHS20C15_32070 [Planctomycetota bacterium]|nr:MAG: hypothetical protein DHS20C15_32070 [Planctomycetota bacterium]
MPRSVLFTLAALCAFTIPLFAQQKNVLVIVADDLGLGDANFYKVSEDPPRTPNLDAMAEQGVSFTNAWSYPFCSPTRAAILTGRYGYRTGIGHLISPHNNEPALPLSEITLPEMVKQGSHGLYRNAAFGKWHVGNLSNGGDLAPNLAGFANYKGILAGSADQYFDADAVENGVVQPQEGYLTTTTVQDVQQWVGNTDSRPWFAYLAFHAAHTPLHAPPSHLHSNPNLVAGTIPDASSPDKRAYFKAMVEAMDREIGNLFEALENMNELAHTTIVFIGDNGALGQIIAPPYFKQQAKGTVYEGGVNVPLIVVDPDVVMPGRVSHSLVHAVDIFATVAEAADIDVAATFPHLVLDSRSLMPFVDFKTAPTPREELYTEHFSPNGGEGPFTYYRKAARDRRYKLIQLDTGESMFDLLADPYEQIDLLLGELNVEQQRAYVKLSEVCEENGLQ